MASAASRSLRIDAVRAVDLDRFLRDFDPRGEAPMVPLSRERAAAQSNNPHASETDVGLLVAYEGTRCVAYLGLLPAVLKIDSRSRKIHWFSGWYVDPAYRKTSIGSLLLLKAFSLKYDLFMTGLSKDSEGLLRAMRLPELRPLKYYQMDLDLPVRVATLPLRLVRRLARSIGREPLWLEAATDRCSRSLSVLKVPLYWWLSREGNRTLDDVECVPVENTSELSLALTPDKAEPVFHRGPDVIDWMLRHKWVPEGAPTEDDQKYRFMARRESLTFVAIKVSKGADQPCLGAAVLSISSVNGHRTLKVLDSSLREGDKSRLLWGVALRYVARFRVDRLEMPETLGPYVKSPLSLLLRQRTRAYFCRLGRPDEEISRLLPSVRLNIYDGDQAFA